MTPGQEALMLPKQESGTGARWNGAQPVSLVMALQQQIMLVMDGSCHWHGMAKCFNVSNLG